MSDRHGVVSAGMAVGTVGLGVADLERSIDWYTGAIGLRVLDRSSSVASLGAGGERLLELTEVPGAAPARGHTGLFHFALRVPARADLARWAHHAVRERVPIAGMADHFVSEAIYLQDPDDHGIEIYVDRPREVWDGRVASMTTLPLDVEGLLGAADAGGGFDGLPDGTDMGHIHLRVADIADTVVFYRDVLGLDLMLAYGAQAVFLAAGGYHHHIGANTWQSRGATPAPDGSAALRFTTLTFPDADSRDAAVARAVAAGGRVESQDGVAAVRDPSGNPIRLALV